MEWKVVTSVNVLAGLFGIRTQQKVFYVGRHSASSSNLPILYPSDPDHYLSPEATATYVGNNKTTHEVFKGFVPDLRKADGEAAQLSEDKTADSALRRQNVIKGTARGFLVCDVCFAFRVVNSMYEPRSDGGPKEATHNQFYRLKEDGGYVVEMLFQSKRCMSFVMSGATIQSRKHIIVQARISIKGGERQGRY